MAKLQTSGAISLGDLRNHFNPGSNVNECMMNQFYKGGGLVPNNNYNSSIPTADTISLQNFYGASNETYQLRVDTHPINEYDEGDNVTMTLTTTGVANTTVINSRTTGIQSADVVGNPSLDFPLTINNNEAVVSFQIYEDFVSDGGVDSNGIPILGNENATTTLYQGAAGTSPLIGGDEGAVSWQIVDSSLSWYVTVTSPGISGGIYTVSNEHTEIRQVGYNSEVQVHCSMPAFVMNASHNNPLLRTPSVSFSVGVALDSGYGVLGRLCTDSDGYSLNQNNNRTLYNGNSYTPSGPTWSNGTTNPSIQINRYAAYDTGYAVGTYWMEIAERGRFVFSELSSPNRVLGETGGGMNFQTPQCIFKTKHILEVTQSGGG